MFATNYDRSVIAYKDLIRKTVLLFDSAGNCISNTNVRCSNWQLITSLFEVPIKVLIQVTNKVN
jgi:hypothetical protein